VDARISGASVEVTVTQRYRNLEQHPVEAVYVFPLDQAAAVCGFAALVGERLIRGHVEEREAAFAAYDDAMHAGDAAFLLDQERPNVFTASVGNLRPGETVELQIRYVALLAREGNALRLTIPTSVSPRYVPAAKVAIGQPDGERVNPEHWPRVPYGLSLSVNVEGTALLRVESPSHPLRTTLDEAWTRVELSQAETALDRDFVLLVERRALEQPRAYVAREADGRRVVMLNFMPDDLESEQGHEVLFLLDCSGSMQGESIAQAKRALALCIRALGERDSFNVIRFGSQHRSLWTAPRRFDQSSLDEATRHVTSIEADLGGTEILQPLSALLEAPLKPEAQRRVLVLTDGQVSNEAEIIALAQKHAGQARIFAFGIGAGASEHLVRGMARASRGAAEMIFPGERIEPKVLRTFARVRTAVLDDVHVDYKGLSVEQAPRRTPPVFAGDVLSVFARIEAGTADHVELVAGARRFRIEVDLERAEAGGAIPTLWARECIRELEDMSGSAGGSQQNRPERADRRRERLVELGKRHGLLSSATSFVAIEERTPQERTSQPAELRRIPVALTGGWGGVARASMAPAAAAPPMFAAPAGTRAAVPMRARSMAPRMAPAASAGAEPAEPYTGGLGSWADAKRLPLGGREMEAGDANLRASSDAAQSAADSSGADRVFDLLMTQRADGSFLRSPVLERWLGTERSVALTEACKLHAENLVVTSVVIALLSREAADRESEWRPALAKARRFCAQQAASFDAGTIVP
jgi:Ca-activated chloride channel family protein